MEGIGGCTITNDFGVNSGASLFGRFELFKDHDACTFANYEPIAITLKRSRRMNRILVIGRECAHGGKARDTHRSDGRFRTLSLIHISEPTRLLSISYAVFCLK